MCFPEEDHILPTRVVDFGQRLEVSPLAEALWIEVLMVAWSLVSRKRSEVMMGSAIIRIRQYEYIVVLVVKEVRCDVRCLLEKESNKESDGGCGGIMRKKWPRSHPPVKVLSSNSNMYN